MSTKSLAVILLAAVLICGCASERVAPVPVVSMDSEIKIESAEFGMGTHVVDVTQRVADLLRVHPEGFIADYKSLQADPLPGAKKVLSIEYVYKGAKHTLTIPGAHRLTRNLLVKKAES